MNERFSGRIRVTLLVGALLAVGMAVAFAQPDDHDHHHHHATGAELALELYDGERWVTDESLRMGMNEIHQHFDTAHDAYRAGQLEHESAVVLADQVDEQVQFIFAHCNLPDEADAELHKLLAATLSATRTLRESDDVHDGLHALHQVLASYGEYFDHPDWSAKTRH